MIFYLDSYSPVNRKTLDHPFPTYSGDFRSFNGIIDTFINMGADRSKLSILVEPYGFSFKRVACTSETELNCPAAGLGSVIYSDKTIVVESKNPSPFIHDRPTICRIISDPEWTKKYDDAAQVPYAYNSEQWIGYDNEESNKAKVNILNFSKSLVD